MAEIDGSEPIRFSGTPRQLEAIVTIPGAGPYVCVNAKLDSTHFYQGREPPPQPLVSARPLASGIFRIKLKFPAAAPAGVYLGLLEFDGVQRRFEAEVKAQPSLRASPSYLSFRAGAGEQLTACLTVVNAGNGDYEIPSAGAVGLFAEGGLETSLGKAYRTKDSNGERWIDRLGDNLTDQHGGLIHIRIVDGAGLLRPGEMRLLRLNLRLPEELQTEKIYVGTLALGGLVLALEVNTSKTLATEALR